jgi:hypothetical protein
VPLFSAFEKLFLAHPPEKLEEKLIEGQARAVGRPPLPHYF